MVWPSLKQCLCCLTLTFPYTKRIYLHEGVTVHLSVSSSFTATHSRSSLSHNERSCCRNHAGPPSDEQLQEFRTVLGTTVSWKKKQNKKNTHLDQSCWRRWTGEYHRWCKDMQRLVEWFRSLSIRHHWFIAQRQVIPRTLQTHCRSQLPGKQNHNISWTSRHFLPVLPQRNDALTVSFGQFGTFRGQLLCLYETFLRALFDPVCLESFPVKGKYRAAWFSTFTWTHTETSGLRTCERFESQDEAHRWWW